MNTNTMTHNDLNPVSVTFSDCFNEYRKGKTGDKRLRSKAARKAARAMREYRRGKTTRHIDLMGLSYEAF